MPLWPSCFRASPDRHFRERAGLYVDAPVIVVQNVALTDGDGAVSVTS